MWPIKKATIFFIAFFCLILSIVCLFLGFLFPKLVLFGHSCFEAAAFFLMTSAIYAVAFLGRHFIVKEKWEWPF